MYPRRRGFTLIELIVVMGIISILAGFSLYGYQIVRQRSQKAKAKAEMLALGSAILSYHNTHKDDVDPNNRWPRRTEGLNTVPWELIDAGLWLPSQKLINGLTYVREPCDPKDGGSIDPVTLVSPGVPPNLQPVSKDDDSRQYICAASPTVDYLGVRWRGLDGVGGTNDDGFLLIYTNRSPVHFNGSFMLKISGTEESCDNPTNCMF